MREEGGGSERAKRRGVENWGNDRTEIERHRDRQTER